MSPRNYGDSRRRPGQCSCPNACNIDVETCGGWGGPSRQQRDDATSTNPRA